jgi:hypothetical protein
MGADIIGAACYLKGWHEQKHPSQQWLTLQNGSEGMEIPLMASSSTLVSFVSLVSSLEGFSCPN